MNSINKLTVKLNDREVGVLCMAQESPVCVFEYTPEWLSSGFSISPIQLPLRQGLFTATEEPFAGNFGIFADSLPDGYGRYLLHKILKRKGIDSLSLNPLQFLSIVGTSGMGALSYSPHTSIVEKSPELDLDQMQELALNVLSEKSDGDEELLYYNSGNSGGCRPKTLMSDAEGHWLVKFRHFYDPADIGVIEYKYAEAAKDCGIDVPDFKLVKGKYFASKRFDIDADGTRLHTATAGALLNENIFPPKVDYINLVHLTGFLTQSTKQVEQMIRRMAFNVYAQNKDDHAKNFSFICQNGNWRIAPAYDLTYNPQGYRGEHATSANYAGNPVIEDMWQVAKSIRISQKRFNEIVEPIREIATTLVDNISKR